MEMDKYVKITLENNNQKFPFVETVIIYLTGLYLFLTGLISGTFFVKSLFLMIIIMLTLLFIRRKSKAFSIILTI
ncbi:hypothetical protein FIU87_19445 [Bacillus sp. THAF10]|nr:hypothetical protein FIU87_19445 [Bacillus sp. THAF10]